MTALLWKNRKITSIGPLRQTKLRIGSHSQFHGHGAVYSRPCFSSDHPLHVLFEYDHATLPYSSSSYCCSLRLHFLVLWCTIVRFGGLIGDRFSSGTPPRGTYSRISYGCRRLVSCMPSTCVEFIFSYYAICSCFYCNPITRTRHGAMTKWRLKL